MLAVSIITGAVVTAAVVGIIAVSMADHGEGYDPKPTVTPAPLVTQQPTTPPIVMTPRGPRNVPPGLPFTPPAPKPTPKPTATPDFCAVPKDTGGSYIAIQRPCSASTHGAHFKVYGLARGGR